jgi:protein TonB
MAKINGKCFRFPVKSGSKDFPMMKSTATSGAAEVQAAAARYFLWEAPGKPVSVRLGLNVVDRLEREVLEAFRAITRRGSEIGGILLGKSESSGGAIIEDYELVTCEYTRGPLYLLSDEEREQMADALRRRKAGGQALSAIGFFRSNTRKELALDEDDLLLYQQYFARPEQVFLLVKPFATKASLGGLFIREISGIRTQASYLEFPFRKSELESGDWARRIVAESPRVTESPRKETTLAADAMGAPAPAPKPATRATVLPFALKREEEAPPPAKREERAAVLPFTVKQGEDPPAPVRKLEPAPPPTPPAAKTTERAAPVAPPVERKLETPVLRKERPALPPLMPREEKPSAPSVKEKVKEAAQETARPKEPVKETPKPQATEPAPEAQPLARSPYGGKKLWALFGGLGMLALAGGTFLYLNARPKTNSAPLAAHESSALQLRAEPQGNQVVLTWNPDAQLVKTAEKAVLSIADGSQNEDVQLDPAQIQAGRIVYTPVTSEVTFRLEVASKLGKNQSEFIRVLRPAPETDQSSVQKPPATPVPVKPQAQPEPEASRPAPADAPAVETQAQRIAVPLKPFSIASRVRSVEQAELPEPPVEQSRPTVAAASPISSTGIAVPAPPPVPKPAVQAPPPAQEPVQHQTVVQAPRVGGKVVPPQVQRRVEPAYPPMARQARVAGSVRLQATIGKDGRVKKVEVLSGPTLLRQAAIDAVQRWVYNPSTLNGAPIDAIAQMELNFNLATTR